MQITNNSTTHYDFVINGEPEIAGFPLVYTLGPGETGEIDVDLEAEQARLTLLAEQGAISGPDLPAKKETE